MLKIVHSICCGVDVHKTFVVATIGKIDPNGVTSHQTKRFSTFSQDLLHFLQWLKDNDCHEVYMESTGKYWYPVFNALEDEMHITLAHPKYVRTIRGQKTDRKDSIWICDLHKHGLVPGSFIPPRPIRQLRELLRYRMKLRQMAASERNRAQNAMTTSNVMLSNVLTRALGKNGRAVLDHLLDAPEDNGFDVRSCLIGPVKARAEQIQASIAGAKIDTAQSCKLRSCLRHIEDIDGYIAAIDRQIEELAKPYEGALKIIESMPGIGRQTALVILSEIGDDMTVFQTSKRLCSWAGLAPGNDQSAGKHKSIRISHGGSHLKPNLIQCANQAIRVKEFGYYCARYESIRKRRGPKRAVIAIARMMMTAIFHMLQNGELFDPTRYEAAQQQRCSRHTDEARMVSILTAAGYRVEAPAMVSIPDGVPIALA